MTAPDPRLGEIAARITAASEGPWAIDTDDFDGYAVFMDDGITWGRAYVCNGLNQGEDEGKADAEFIANAPADVSYLLAALADRDAKLARVEALHEPVAAVMYSGSQQRMVQVCTGCGTDDGNWMRWPCPTRAAVADTTGGEDK